MTTTQLEVEEALALQNKIVIDVRAPIEYKEFHIPGAINLPLINDIERHELGIIHKNEGPVTARRVGLKYIAPRLVEMCDQYLAYSKQGNVVIYCWRGGMRSKSISDVLSLLKIRHYRIEGGIKAYRRHVRTKLEEAVKPKLVVLHGLTGVGKTSILHILRELGCPVIDIEYLANHRGSAFGHVGIGSQPSQKMFDAYLYEELRRYADSPYIIVECESRRTGKLALPNTFFDAMQQGLHLLTYTTIPLRVKRIIKEYSGQNINQEALAEAIKRLKPRLGKIKTNYLLECLERGELEELVTILLKDYYDPLYGYNDHADLNYDLNVDAENLQLAAKQIKQYCQKVFN